MPIEESKRKEIEKKIRELLDKFSHALSGIRSEESNVVRDKDRREEKDGKECVKNFREIMFENAPNKDENFIIAERKTW